MKRARDLLRGLTQSLPGGLPTELPEASEEPKLAFCPLLFQASGETKGICGDVQCGRCEYLDQAYRPEDIYWLCSSCSQSGKSHPFWHDGNCDACGLESSVLVLTDR